MNEKEQLQAWFSEAKFARPERFRFSEEDSGQGRVIFCTRAHTYSIHFTAGYLGCVASSRTVLPGEDWTRGSDLPDGSFSRETFDEIIKAIVAYELVDLAPVAESVLADVID